MSQEQRDSYVIPPNFIEGGSFFGGLFKARNVVEAVILAAGTGNPGNRKPGRGSSFRCS